MILNEYVTDAVTIDHEKAMTEMLKKVYSEGFERVGFFSQPPSHNEGRRKHKLFIEGSKNWVKNANELIYIVDKESFGGSAYQKTLQTFLDNNKDSRLAVFAENGTVMLNLVNVISRLGWQIPADIGICGYDELDLKDIVDGGISVISNPSYQVGFQAAELLIKRIAKGKDQYKSKQIDVQPEIEMKKSTKINESSFDRIVRSINEENELIVKNYTKRD